ncbi:MAG TPA: saccharopine dehydrogenase NADP-binding domain-containing protein [Solirubrobacterales bacterium]|nr:saccharopine dehydrogenase NADP-binding domain-containing protein [Solirubrobacterales bacterium]
MTESERDHDIVLYGATGFVGVLTAKYLAEHTPPDVRIALGGRSRDKLEKTRAELGVDWPLVIADSQDRDAVAAMAESARVVATTVGPYFKYGKPLVEACATAGTHYADLTGEVLFMRWSIDAADAKARAGGARIVHTCGFDSIPSDIGTLLLHEAAQAGGHGELGETTLVVKAMRGGASGGTIDSARTAVDAVKKDPPSRRVLADPYALSPDREVEPDLGPERDSLKPFEDDRLGGWLAPFVMGSVNTRVVRRSNALQGHAYGRRFRYRELMLTGRGPLGLAKAAGVAGGIAGVFAGLATPGARQLLDRVLPAPGEGPDESTRERGFFAIDIHSTTSDGERLRCEIRVQGDPGYKATGVMLGESALCLALDDLPDAAGVLTPASAMGRVLADRLIAAGHSYRVVSD